jgi:hypothetical protein
MPPPTMAPSSIKRDRNHRRRAPPIRRPIFKPSRGHRATTSIKLRDPQPKIFRSNSALHELGLPLRAPRCKVP